MSYILSWIWKILSYYLPKYAFFLSLFHILQAVSYLHFVSSFNLGIFYRAYKEKCLLGFVFHFMNSLTFNFLNVSIAYLFQLQRLFFTFRSPSSIILPVLVTQSCEFDSVWALLTVKVCSTFWFAVGVLLMAPHFRCEFDLLTETLCWSSFKAHSTERSGVFQSWAHSFLLVLFWGVDFSLISHWALRWSPLFPRAFLPLWLAAAPCIQ